MKVLVNEFPSPSSLPPSHPSPPHPLLSKNNVFSQQLINDKSDSLDGTLKGSRVSLLFSRKLVHLEVIVVD